MRVYTTPEGYITLAHQPTNQILYSVHKDAGGSYKDAIAFGIWWAHRRYTKGGM